VEKRFRQMDFYKSTWPVIAIRLLHIWIEYFLVRLVRIAIISTSHLNQMDGYNVITYQNSRETYTPRNR